MGNCTCDELEDELIDAEMDVEEAKKEVERYESDLEFKEYILEELKGVLEEMHGADVNYEVNISNACVSGLSKSEIEDAIEQLKETISKIKEELEEWKQKLQDRKDKYDEIKDKLDDCYSSLTGCEACGEEFVDKEECGRECEGCGRWYCTNCFDEAIESAELAAGEAF